MSIRAILVSSAAALMAASCASTVTRQDLDRQESSVRSGDEKALDTLYNKRSNVKEPERQKYVEVIGEASTEKSSVILRSLYDDPGYQNQKGPILDALARQPDERNAEFIRTKLGENPALYDDQLESYLIQRGDRPSAETVLAMVEQGKGQLNPRTIGFFAQTGLAAALPVLEARADQGNDVVPVMDAIARFGTPEAGNYLLQTAKKTDHPGRIAAIRRLSSVSDQTEARAYLHSLLQDSTQPAELIAAVECLREMGFNEDSYNLIRRLYYKTGDASVRTAALESMATLRQVDATELAKELEGNRKNYPDLADRSTTSTENKQEPGSRQTNLSRAYENKTSRLSDIIKNRPPRSGDKTTEEERKEARENHRTPRALFHSDESDAGSSRYDRRLGNSLTRIFQEDASSVRIKIHNALLTYADSDSGNARFVQRSYRKGFGVDEAKAKELLGKGLHVPNSLEVVLSAVTSEYGRHDLQVYALESFFAIKRKQAEKLIDAYRHRSL